MSIVKTPTRDRFSLPDWLPRSTVLPYVLSLVAHACLLILFASTLRSCQQSPVGFSDEPMREVGIFVEREGDREDAQVAGEVNDAPPSESTAESIADQLTPTQATSDTPPADVVLPTADTASTIGAGAVNLPAGAQVLDPREPVKSNGGARPARGMTGGVPGTSFMGTRDDGMKVVFVIDASGSMTSHNAMQVAKGALLSSLQALDERQQFLIIFYDDKPHVIKLQDESKPTLAYATDLNKTLARQKISGIQPGSGTDHLPPLEMALRMSPDVIFFLTDALEPPLWPKDLDKIKSLNGGRVRIHSIEFGQGPELAAGSDLGNFLRKLARANGGTYRYHDVTRFKAP
ncbi:MAG: VWA domain-containing protein [Planctomycetes bacterium]|nr:VWA domain-containing protein [Planctomycetota bacterium]